MSTVINNRPNRHADEGLGFGLIFGMIILILFLGVLFYIYGVPALQNSSETQNIEIQVPAAQQPVTTSETAE